MITTKQQLKDFIKYEAKFYKQKRALRFLPALKEKTIAWKYVCLLRYEEYHYNKRHRFLALFYHILRIMLGRKNLLFIPINVIDKGFMMIHPHNIVINAKKIGKNFSIQFNCSLVAHGHNGDNPIIGDNVTIGCSSVILGGVHIANGIAIGANSTVNKSFFEENICIAGCPAKKISNNGSLTWNKKNRIND